MRSLILDYQISITALGSCSLLHSKGVSQLNKWARDIKWTSGICIYTPIQNITVEVQLNKYWDDRTHPVGADRTLVRVQSELNGSL